MNPLYVGLELGAGGFFVLAAVAAARRGRLPLLELLSAAMFGILLEEGDQLIFGSYHYAADWILKLDRAPIAIGLTWALILAGAMRITDALGVQRRYAPFVDALLAISLDLAFDAIAIRIGLWTWRGVPSNEGWFGVPAGNFYAWLFVALGFSLVTRWLRVPATRRPRLAWLQLLAPIPAYAILIGGLTPFIVLKPMVDQTHGGGLSLFGVALVAFTVQAGRGMLIAEREAAHAADRAMLDLRMAFLSRLAIHAFFLAALLVLGLATREPVLLAAAVALLAAELPLAWLVRARTTRAPLMRGAEAKPVPQTAADGARPETAGTWP
ncbi:MAG: carotenoid biosynthesis protein [Candidatus Limnocylindria bacterium]